MTEVLLGDLDRHASSNRMARVRVPHPVRAGLRKPLRALCIALPPQHEGAVREERLDLIVERRRIGFSKPFFLPQLLYFERLQASAVDNYDFANGAPAVGACLDLVGAAEVFARAYHHKPQRKNLSRYFFNSRLPNIQVPLRRFFTTNDPVLTPALMDYFFNQRTQVFDTLDDRKRLLLRSIYDHAAFAAVLPVPAAGIRLGRALRQHQRFSIRCPARLSVASYGARLVYLLQVTELSLHGFRAECAMPLPEGTCGRLKIELGQSEAATVEATAVRRQDHAGTVTYGFMVAEPDEAWQRCVAALHASRTSTDLALPAFLPSLPLQQGRPALAVVT